jgi:hypothetical protein
MGEYCFTEGFGQRKVNKRKEAGSISASKECSMFVDCVFMSQH